ncbi:MAG: F0F1 ATP synthase subunit A [Oscillospiraceae bacterium]
MEGPKIYFTIPVLGGIPITETTVNMWIVMAAIAVVCRILTRRMQKIPKGKQALAEKYVSTIYTLCAQTMGPDKLRYAPYIGTLLPFSLLSSLLGLFALRPPTADLNTTVGWADYLWDDPNRQMACQGPGRLLQKLCPACGVILPINLVSEVSTPVSMAFRHFGNIAAGMVITSALWSVVRVDQYGVRRWRAVFAGGNPAFLSIYFDVFTARCRRLSSAC